MAKTSWIGFDIRANFPISSLVTNPHITLIYLGTELSDRSASTVLKEVSEWFSFYGSHVDRKFIKVSGWDVFNNNIVALLDFPELAEHRDILVNYIEDYGIKIAKDYEFTPHITVAYSSEAEETHNALQAHLQMSDSPKITLTGLFVMHKGRRVFNYDFLKENRF